MTDRNASPMPTIVGAASFGVAVFWMHHAWGQRRDARAVLDALERDRAGGAPTGATAATDAWVFPVPNLNDRPAVISDGWGSARINPNESRRSHLGVDLMFRRRHAAELVDQHPPGSQHGSQWHFMPDNVPALAVAPGVVTFAANTPRGFTVKIQHLGWTSYYTHLSALVVVAGQAVAAGQPLGTIGGDPLDARHLMHLHFELWRDHVRTGAVDPAPLLRAARRRTLAAGGELRNRGDALTYRPIGAPGERYPAWVRDLRGSSGVYVIRERGADGAPVTVYVGESHTGRLYETLTRHFQTWRRFKGFWRGQYAEGHDPGLTYPRASVEVAARVLPADQAIDEERRLIRRLSPRDNLIGQTEDVPF